VRLYEWDGKTLKEVGVLGEARGIVSVLAFSPDGTMLAVGDVSASQNGPFVTLKETMHPSPLGRSSHSTSPNARSVSTLAHALLGRSDTTLLAGRPSHQTGPPTAHG
jgi:hypothetical protein